MPITTPENTEEHLSDLRNEAAFVIQKSWKEHHLKQLSTAVARIHELESIVTRFVKADITSKFHELQEELGKKNTICAIIEQQNEDLTTRILELEQQAQSERQSRLINDDDITDDAIKKMAYSMKEMSIKSDQLSDMLHSSEHQKSSLQSDFIKLESAHKAGRQTIVELKHNLDKTIEKNGKLQFSLRSLRNKLRDALSFKELYHKLKNKSVANKMHSENALNELKTTHWSTLQQMREYKENK